MIFGTESLFKIKRKLKNLRPMKKLILIMLAAALVSCEPECVWVEETAYAGDVTGDGNAWWFAIDASQSGDYPIYAGQELVPGASVSYDAGSDQITLNFSNDIQLQNVDEPVKVEGYETLPDSRPAAGLFELYKGSDQTIQGNGSNYYVVHLDVEVCE